MQVVGEGASLLLLLLLPTKQVIHSETAGQLVAAIDVVVACSGGAMKASLAKHDAAAPNVPLSRAQDEEGR